MCYITLLNNKQIFLSTHEWRVLKNIHAHTMQVNEILISKDVFQNREKERKKYETKIIGPRVYIY
jgi:hypothetical protein